jgi:ribosome-associated translation inhibitor RaiA
VEAWEPVADVSVERRGSRDPGFFRAGFGVSSGVVVFGKEQVMRLEIRQRGMKVTEELRVHVRERLRLALGRFARSIAQVWVYLRDVNGPRGGLSKKCRIVVELPRRGRVVVTGVDTDIFAAITRTASRTKFAVRRNVKQRLARRRPLARPRRSCQGE